MTDGPFLPPEQPARGLGWLDLLATLMPETVKLEVSSYLLIVALVALWIWRSCAPRGAQTAERVMLTEVAGPPW
jgi:hypothetical protein